MCSLRNGLWLTLHCKYICLQVPQEAEKRQLLPKWPNSRTFHFSRSVLPRAWLATMKLPRFKPSRRWHLYFLYLLFVANFLCSVVCHTGINSKAGWQKINDCYWLCAYKLCFVDCRFLTTPTSLSWVVSSWMALNVSSVSSSCFTYSVNLYQWLYFAVQFATS